VNTEQSMADHSSLQERRLPDRQTIILGFNKDSLQSLAIPFAKSHTCGSEPFSVMQERRFCNTQTQLPSAIFRDLQGRTCGNQRSTR